MLIGEKWPAIIRGGFRNSVKGVMELESLERVGERR